MTDPDEEHSSLPESPGASAPDSVPSGFDAGAEEERGREPIDGERQLRRELARTREQTRVALAERDAAMVSLQQESNTRLIRSELQLRALQHGIVDLDALRMLDLSAITIDAGGTVVGAEEVLSGFREAKPYLFDVARAVGRGVSTSAGGRTPARAEVTALDARQLSREQWQLERARLLSKRGRGRVRRTNRYGRA